MGRLRVYIYPGAIPLEQSTFTPLRIYFGINTLTLDHSSGKHCPIKTPIITVRYTEWPSIKSPYIPLQVLVTFG